MCRCFQLEKSIENKVENVAFFLFFFLLIWKDMEIIRAFGHSFYQVFLNLDRIGTLLLLSVTWTSAG